MRTAFRVANTLALLLITTGLLAQEIPHAANQPGSVSLNGAALHSGKVVYSQKAQSPEVPEGRPRIAHRFNGGLRNEMELVPSGTKESYPRESRPKIVGTKRWRRQLSGLP